MIKNRPAFAAALAAVIAIPAVPIMAQGADAHISGQGRLLKERTFSINVFANADGSARGQATLVRRDFPNDTENAPIIEKVEVTCANRVDASTVVFGAKIIRSNNSALPTTRYFAVRDNGNPGAGTDEMSFSVPTTLGENDPLFCLNLPVSAFSLSPVLKGNIKVRG